MSAQAERQPGLGTPPAAGEWLPRVLWLYLPVAVALAVLVAYSISPDWSWRYLLVEGRGAIEIAHFVIPLGAAICAARAWLRLPRRSDRRLAALLIALAAGSVYIAGEEMSWGQHVFHWQTPEGWGEINRQNETNLHNATSWLNEKPRVLLNVLIIAATVLVPPMQARGIGAGLLDRVRFVLPGRETRVAGLLVLFYMVWDSLAKDGILPKVAPREAEMHELYLYAFILIYTHTLGRRIEAWRGSDAGGDAGGDAGRAAGTGPAA